jgi:hypothetical protein
MNIRNRVNNYATTNYNFLRIGIEGTVTLENTTITGTVTHNGISNLYNLVYVSAGDRSYIRCGPNSSGYYLNIGSTGNASSTMYDTISCGVWTSFVGALHLNPSTNSNIVYANFYNVNGLFSVGGALPAAKLHVGSGATTTGNIYQKYLSVYLQEGYALQTLTNECAIFDSSLWCKDRVTASSDVRIKTNIQDINDDLALQKILQIQPKTYEYIDKVERGNDTVYGFIAQQIKEVIPEAIKLQKGIIPNIYKVCKCVNDIITISGGIENLKVNDEIDVVIKNNETKRFNIIEVNEDSIKINETINDDECFVIGSHIEDFHALDKTYIYTLNVCATQELYKIIQDLQNRISILENK